MGYILPITPYVYMNYQKRMEKETEVSHQIDALYKVILETNQNKQAPVYDTKETGTKEVNDTKELNKLTIELTGKGARLDVEV